MRVTDKADGGRVGVRGACGGYPLLSRAGQTTSLPRHAARYNHSTNLLGIQMKDFFAAVFIAMCLLPLALAYFDVLIK